MEELKFIELSIHSLNPNAVILTVSAKTGEGLQMLEDLLLEEIRAMKASS